MALTGAKHESIHDKTGDDLAAIKASFDNGEHSGLIDFGPESALIYQMQKMQDELDYLRTANTAKVSLAGGSGTTLSFGEMITTGKGKTATYSIVMTAIKSGVTKTVTLTLA